jgi:hypothetical protein
MPTTQIGTVKAEPSSPPGEARVDQITSPLASSVVPGTTIASLILGIASLVAWLLPIVGFPVALIGLVLGLLGRQQLRSTWATVSLALCIIGLTLTAINAGLGAYSGMSRQVSGPSFVVVDGSQEIDLPLYQPAPGDTRTVPVSAVFRNMGSHRGSQIADFFLRDSAGGQMSQCRATTSVTDPGGALRAGCNESVKFFTFYGTPFKLEINLGAIQESD